MCWMSGEGRRMGAAAPQCTAHVRQAQCCDGGAPLCGLASVLTFRARLACVRCSLAPGSTAGSLVAGLQGPCPGATLTECHDQQATVHIPRCVRDRWPECAGVPCKGTQDCLFQ